MRRRCQHVREGCCGVEGRRTLLRVNAVEHGRVLEHVGQNHEAHVAAAQVAATKRQKHQEDNTKRKGGKGRGFSHLLQTGDLAVLSREHYAAQLAAHVVFSFHESPAVHLAVAQLHCTQSRGRACKKYKNNGNVCSSARATCNLESELDVPPAVARGGGSCAKPAAIKIKQPDTLPSRRERATACA